MTKLEEQNKVMAVAVKEARSLSKTASTTLSDLKKKVEMHEKRLQTIGRA
jgi:hypothetical protein